MAGIYVGVLRVVLWVPGARSLKQGRKPIVALRDRVRHRFGVTFHEIETRGSAERVVVLTTAGNDARTIRSVLDRIRSFIEAFGHALPRQVDVDVFRWHPPDERWDPADFDDTEGDLDG